ncbi:MFS transporter [Actinocatenispora thailandica]|uniref:MFS transporter n=1 Tax=Actinocatenispora thailandica TaxID=227318 RepID=A0A7R7DJJ4_9ACTN|nr:MFS transporter [Actinocatenispora thailandica]BCJ32597.1 MFS transporter [Actinocatenispora thailandica]
MTSVDARAAAIGEYTPDPRRWRALTVCLIAGFMTLLDVSIVNVALPSMQDGLHATASDLSWVISGYALTFGLVLVTAGRLGDDRGRKRMFLAGLVLFTATSALAGAATSGTWLVLARLFQGAAGGLLNPQVIGVIQQLFRGRERGRAFGLFGAVVGISTAVGPLLGGLLLQGFGDQEGWRFVFYVNLPIGVLALFAGARLLPHDRVDRTGSRHTLDLVGVLLLGAAVVSIMLPLIEAEKDPSGAPWWLLAVGAALLAGFVGWEVRYRRRSRQPLVDLALLRARSYAMGTSLGLAYFAGFTGIFFVITLFFQRGLGYTPLAAGAAMLPFAIGSAGAAAIGGRIVSRYGRALVVLGVLAVAVGLAGTDLVLGAFGGAHVALVTAVPLALAGIGSGLTIAPNQTLTLAEVPPAEGGTAAGVLQTGQRIGSAIGTAVAGALFFGSLATTHGDYHRAAALGIRGSIALVLVALLVGLVDLAFDRRRRRAGVAPGGTGGARV